MNPVTTYHIIARTKPPEKRILYQKLPELSPPFGLKRYPPYQFSARLRDFPPNLVDIIAVASTDSTDISLVTRSKTPLTTDLPADKIINVFTTTQVTDSRRAQLPMTEDLADTSPIGFAFDLSSKDKVKRPLPGEEEEYDESSGPLPALVILNNEGILATWWLIYAESIRQRTTFPGLAATGAAQTQQTQPQYQQGASPFAAPSQPSAPTFRQSSFGNPSTPSGNFGASANTSNAPPFGSSPAPGSLFGAASALGQSKSPWGASLINAGGQGSTPTFGKPSSGGLASQGVNTQGTAFGMAGGLGNRVSPWGTPSSSNTATTGSTFGQTGKLGSLPSPFATGPSSTSLNPQGAANGSPTTTSGFASFANKPGGFASTPSSSGGFQSVFAKPPTGSVLGSGSNTGSSFGQLQKPTEQIKSPFGTGAFSLGSTFKADGTSIDDASKPTGAAVNSLFGANFNATLGEAVPQSKDEDMDESEDVSPTQATASNGVQDAKEPVADLAPPELPLPKTEPPKIGGLFGTQSQGTDTLAEVQSSKPTGFGFGQPTPLTVTSKETIDESNNRPPRAVETSPKIKEEPTSDDDDISPLNEEEAQPPEGYGESVEPSKSSLSKSPKTPAPPRPKLPEAPLPPESTSKTSYAPGDSSNSSKSSDDPSLPPDFAPSKSKLQEVEATLPEESALPEEEAEDEGSEEEEGRVEALDDEGSGVDVGQEISPLSSKESSKITPVSSFGMGPENRSPDGLFSTASKKSELQKIPLFGEAGKPPVQLFPTSSKTQESPRSPSPVRMGSFSGSLRPENTRSVSTPGPASSWRNRRSHQNNLVTPLQAQNSAEEIRRQERERLLDEQAQKAQQEQQPLEDDEDEQIRRTLAADIEGSITLDDFVAHQDYVGDVDKPGIPGQVEKVYRDINSMIDTLGLNARSLKAFIKGHEELAKTDGRSREDLESLDDWCLVEIEDLDALESDLFEQLNQNKLPDVSRKLSDIREIRGAVSHLEHQSVDLGRTIDFRKDPAAVETASRAPLDLDQQTQLRDLRKAFTKFQKQLVDAEEGVTMLRTKLAYTDSQYNGIRKNGKEPAKQPTVEAVENTVRKMTAMIERKSADIDILSSQMEEMSLSPDVNDTINLANGAHSGQGSSSTFTTPYPNSASKMYRKALQQKRYRPAASLTPHKESPLRSGFNSEGTTNKSVISFTAEEVEEYKTKVSKKQEINEVVRDIFRRNGAKIRTLD